MPSKCDFKESLRAAVSVNKELLSLYYGIGRYISENSRQGFWGTNAIETISLRLQQEVPGLRGYSPVNIKRMRQFYETWKQCFECTDNDAITNRPLVTDEIQIDILIGNRPLLTDDLNMEYFLSVGFTHHYELLIKTFSLAERLFYIEHCVTEFWSVEKLKYNLKSNLYSKKGTLPNNFITAIADSDLRQKGYYHSKMNIFWII